ncbi:SHOCT domain-containing protein [Natrinema caseinilyticum]|uniref:SHOCT domain-containing protein n=1 Tax=Natrinema caseinilyticum TaxID=2961570 RepID=UPI0020C49A52|nr:SHOCT domain-containing protein [Natrinema caseinilyticum]
MNGTEGTNREPPDDGPWTRLRENATAVASMLVTAFWLGAMFTGQEWWLAALLVGYIAVVPLVAILFGDEEDRREWVDDYSSGETDSNTNTNTNTNVDSAAAGPADEAGTDVDAHDALETLRERYAAGELTDEQFERKLERLLNTETLESAAQWRRDAGTDRERETEHES